MLLKVSVDEVFMYYYQDICLQLHWLCQRPPPGLYSWSPLVNSVPQTP